MSIELPEQLDLLDEFLVSDAVGEDAMTLSELDGFLAGVIVSPEMILPREWLPLVWGEEDPCFEDEQQEQAVFSAIMAHYNDVGRLLDRGKYDPIFDILTAGELSWESWLDGLRQAMNLRLEAWIAFPGIDNPDAQVRTALFSISRLYHITHAPSEDIEPLEIDPRLEELAPDLLADCVATLYRARRDADAASPPFGRPAARRKKRGRNEPCPCGSGKKFKKCCGVS